MPQAFTRMADEKLDRGRDPSPRIHGELMADILQIGNCSGSRPLLGGYLSSYLRFAVGGDVRGSGAHGFESVAGASGTAVGSASRAAINSVSPCGTHG